MNFEAVWKYKNIFMKNCSATIIELITSILSILSQMCIESRCVCAEMTDDLICSAILAHLAPG